MQVIDAKFRVVQGKAAFIHTGERRKFWDGRRQDAVFTVACLTILALYPALLIYYFLFR